MLSVKAFKEAVFKGVGVDIVQEGCLLILNKDEEEFLIRVGVSGGEIRPGFEGGEVWGDGGNCACRE